MPKQLIQDIILKKGAFKMPAKKFLEDEWDKTLKEEKGKEKLKDGEKVKIRTAEQKKTESPKKPFLRFPRLKLPRSRFEIPRPKSKLKLILIFGITGMALIAGGGVVLLNKFLAITVEITPRQEFVSIDASFNASTEPKNGELPLEVMQISREEKDVARASGAKQISKKASGQVIIYNTYSSQPQTLIWGTRLQTPGGKIYRLDKSIVVPGAKAEGGKLTTSEIEVTVFADKPGEDYNIGLSDFIIPGFKDAVKREKIYGRSKTEMKGGFVGEIGVITENDINNLESSLKEKIKDYLLKMSANPKPESFFLYDNAKQIVFDKRSGPRPGDETNQFELMESATLFGFLLNKSDLFRTLGKKYFDEKTAAAVEVINAGELAFELKSFTPTSIVFGLKGQAHFVWKIDEAGLKNDLLKEPKNPNGVFSKYPAIENAKIVFKPGWWHNIPKDPSQITIQRILKETP